MFRKSMILWILLLVGLIGSGLSACSPFTPGPVSQVKTPVATSIPTPTPTPIGPLEKLSVDPGYRSIAQARDVNGANDTTSMTLATFPAQKSVFLNGQCRGSGKLMMYLKISDDSNASFTVPISCKTAYPTGLEYTQKTFPKGEKYSVTLVIEGSVEWQAMVEVSNT